MSLLDVQQYMRTQDIQAFQSAAQFYQIFLLLRRTNTASKKYIGIAGYVPKRLDCKAKTADADVDVPGFGRKQTAGLVVNPTLPGFGTAFRMAKKAQDAQDTWRQFEPLVYFPQPGKPTTYFPQGKFYSVQMDPNHKHYGCVMFASNSLVSAGKYIHGDYDLYGMTARFDPRTDVVGGSPVNTRVTEIRLGQPHARGKEFFDVQHYLNRKMGVAMVLHGDQEKYSAHTDEPIDVFWPDGREPTALNNLAEIQEFYRTVLQGRQPFDKGVKGPQGVYYNR